VFSLITGYSDPPAGVSVRGNVHYNKYMTGQQIAMARNLYDGLVEYPDGIHPVRNHACILSNMWGHTAASRDGGDH
jgi:cytochrome c1